MSASRKDDEIQNLLNKIPDRVADRINAIVTIFLIALIGGVLSVSLFWIFTTPWIGDIGNPPDASNIEVFSGIVGFILSGIIFWAALRSERAASSLHKFLARSWSGVQTDYGADLSGSPQDARAQISRHIEDISRGMCVPREENLDESYFMLSSIAYGIENGPEELARFVDILENVIKHQNFPNSTLSRSINIALWPKLEHQIIWGADRQHLVNILTNGANKKAKSLFSPSLRALVSDRRRRVSENWRNATPNWCLNERNMLKTIACLSRIAHLFESCRNNLRINLEIAEIEQWNGRAFFVNSLKINASLFTLPQLP